MDLGSQPVRAVRAEAPAPAGGYEWQQRASLGEEGIRFVDHEPVRSSGLAAAVPEDLGEVGEVVAQTCGQGIGP